MASRLYVLPPSLGDRVPENQYLKWLQRKAQSLVKRDRRRGNSRATVSRYKHEIHRTIVRDDPLDWYTGEELDWRLISKYSNEEAKKFKRKAKLTYARLPTVDHEDDGQGEPHFRICGWAVNDAKNDLPLADFLRLCERVLAHRDRGLPGKTSK
jgi:hypothetical protein